MWGKPERLIHPTDLRGRICGYNRPGAYDLRLSDWAMKRSRFLAQNHICCSSISLNVFRSLLFLLVVPPNRLNFILYLSTC